MKFSPRWLLAASLLTATPAVAQQAPAETNAEQPSGQAVKTQVDALLAGIEQVPTAADWAKLGEPAVPVLIEIVRDRNAKIVRRGRAAIGLGHFDVDASKQALRMLLIDASTPGLLLRKSMIALAKLDGDAAVDAIAVHLDHRGKRVREQAIKSLGEIRTDRARELLAARAPEESSKYLKELIAAELQKPAIEQKSAERTPNVVKETAQ